MPAHDWRRVTAGTFHDFHLAWIAELRRALNGGLLPPGYYALAEQVAGDIIPDVLTHYFWLTRDAHSCGSQQSVVSRGASAIAATG